MKKRIIVLIAVVLSLVTVLCACSNSISGSKISVKVGKYKIELKTSDDYILESFTENTAVGFAVFYNDEDAENFAIGSFLTAEAYTMFRQKIVSDDNVKEVFENTDTVLYYSVTNEENTSLTEYNRIIKLNSDYVVYIGSFDKDAVDTFYNTLDIKVK